MLRVTKQCDEFGVLIDGIIKHQSLDEGTRNIVIKYMKQREHVISASSARIVDFAAGKQRVEKYCRTKYSDGLYSWTSHDVYYFEKYGMRLCPDFINHVFEQIELKE